MPPGLAFEPKATGEEKSVTKLKQAGSLANKSRRVARSR